MEANTFESVIWPVIILLGIIQGLILSLILFFGKKGNRFANSFLAGFIVLLVWHHLQSLSIYTGLYETFPHFYGTGAGSMFLFGPLFYFYTLILTTENFSFKKVHALHFLPFVVMTIYDPVIFQGTEAKIASIKDWLVTMRYDNPYRDAQFFALNVTFFSEFFHMLAYIVLSINLNRSYSKKIKSTMSNIDKVNLNWLKMLTIGFGVILFVSFLFQRMLYIIINYYYRSMDYIYIMPMTILIYIIGFNAMKQPAVYSAVLPNNGRRKKYEASSLTPQKSKEYAEQLTTFMKTNKPYLDSELRLQTLADELSMHPAQLSQIINEQFGESFFDFVNRYRVEEAKKLLSDPSEENATILKIAFDVGFNNKTSFNNYFKKLTNMTPYQFKNSQKA